MELIIRFDYGSIVPWVRTIDGALRAIGGPMRCRSGRRSKVTGVGLTSQAAFVVREGDAVPFVLRWHPSNVSPSPPADVVEAVRDTEAWWAEWAGQCSHDGPLRSEVVRPAITLKALSFAPAGGMVAAATMSLPEQVGGIRNWDYPYCWLRDATFSLYALVTCGFVEEARSWRDWLLRAVAGEPSKLQIMYGAARGSGAPLRPSSTIS